MYRSIKIAVVLVCCFVLTQTVAARPPGIYDTILTSGIVVGKDTFPYAHLQKVTVFDYMDPERRAELKRLRHNVYKVYPYAVTAAYVLNKVEHEMAIRTNKKDRRAYLKAEERALKEQFKDKLKNLTITQGKILVKLINRETGRNCYDVIKQLKGGFNARIFQTTAFFFDNNLKEQYDPYGEDRDIEMIVQEIEAKNYLKYQRLQLTKE